MKKIAILFLVNVFVSLYVQAQFGVNGYYWYSDSYDYYDKPLIDKSLVLQKLKENNKDFIIFDTIPNKLYKLNKHGKVKEWDIVVNRGNYFILCPDKLRGECRNRDNIYLYIPNKNFTKCINRFFPICPKKDLIKTINRYTNDKIPNKKFEKYCNVIHYLKSLNQ